VQTSYNSTSMPVNQTQDLIRSYMMLSSWTQRELVMALLLSDTLNSSKWSKIKEFALSVAHAVTWPSVTCTI